MGVEIFYGRGVCLHNGQGTLRMIKMVPIASKQRTRSVEIEGRKSVLIESGICT